jgi:protein TonB
MVEVSIEAKDFTASLDSSALPQNDNVSIQNDIGQKQVTRSISGVRGKANPNYFQNPAPEYPELAKQMRQEGLIILAVDVDREGLPIKVEINQSSGFRLLDQAALKAVGHWKFQPGRMGDIPVESTAIVPIRFRLEN